MCFLGYYVITVCIFQKVRIASTHQSEIIQSMCTEDMISSSAGIVINCRSGKPANSRVTWRILFCSSHSPSIFSYFVTSVNSSPSRYDYSTYIYLFCTCLQLIEQLNHFIVIQNTILRYTVLLSLCKCDCDLFTWKQPVTRSLCKQCRKVSEISYMIDWYRLPGKKALAVTLLISMSNSSVKLTAGNLIELSLSSFGDVSSNILNVNYSCHLWFHFSSSPYINRTTYAFFVKQTGD